MVSCIREATAPAPGGSAIRPLSFRLSPGKAFSIALHSARLAAETYLADGNSARYQARLAADLAVRIRYATSISRLLVHSSGQSVAMAAVRLIPGLIGTVARHTRIPSRGRAESAVSTDRHFSLPAPP
jgi:menaquinone-9 beta-reductase